jgi:Peptidase family M48
MSSEPVRTNRRSRPRLRHPAEVPLFIFMVVLNLIIVAAILEAAAVLPFLPERLQDSGWAVAIRGALISLLLFIPALMVVRETQRASTRGTAVQLSERQYPELYQTAEDFTHTLGLRRRPEIFLANGNGALNAFAAQATGYDYVVLSNELFANLYDRNRDGLGFILGHELGHIRLHHVALWYQLAVAYSQWIPLLGRGCRGCASTPVTATAPSCRRGGPGGWSCWPPAATPKPRSTWRSWYGRAACCGGSGSAWPSCPGRTPSPFAAWNVCIASACSPPASNRPRPVSEGRRRSRRPRGRAGPARYAGPWTGQADDVSTPSCFRMAPWTWATGPVTIHLGGPEPLRTAGMPRHPTATGFHTARRPGSIQHRRSHDFAPHR